MISIIAILAKNRAIGFNNKLLYDIPEDMKHFKKITSGQVVIMGENTFHSMNNRPLPNRINIILTLDKNFSAQGGSASGGKANDYLVAYSMEESIKLGEAQEGREIFFIGGGQIYKQALALADKLYLTIVDDEPKQADTFFPDYSEFKKIISEKTIDASGFKITFTELTR